MRPGYQPQILAMYAGLTRLVFPDRWRAYRKKYARSLKGKQSSKRYAAGPKFKVCQKRYHSTIKGSAMRLAQTRRYQTLKRQAIQGARHEIEKIYLRAAILRQWFKVVVDHIIPLSQGGEHTAENLQIIYGFENALKGTTTTYKPKIVFL